MSPWRGDYVEVHPRPVVNGRVSLLDGLQSGWYRCAGCTRRLARPKIGCEVAHPDVVGFCAACVCGPVRSLDWFVRQRAACRAHDAALWKRSGRVWFRRVEAARHGRGEVV